MSLCMGGGSEVIGAPLPRMQERCRLPSHAGGRLQLVRSGRLDLTPAFVTTGRIEGGKAIEHWSVRDDLGQAL